MGDLSQYLKDFDPYAPEWITDLQEAAEVYAKAGLRLIPCKTNKAPTLKAWQTAAKADASTVRGAEMLGVPMGEITCLDIDAKHQAGLIEEFEHACENMALGDLLRALPKQLTVNGGCHYFARVEWLGDPLGNTKLATNADKQTTIETRGKGGFAIVAPSDGYMFVRGSIASVPTITEEEWQQLEAVARSFNAYVKPSKTNNSPSGTSSQGLKPGDDYDKRGDVEGLLESHGWTFQTDELVTRPGKREGISATFGRVGERKLYVFSSNADPFEFDTSYSPFAVYATLLHGGDFSAAARALSSDGYGESSLPEVDAATNAAVDALLSKHDSDQSEGLDATESQQMPVINIGMSGMPRNEAELDESLPDVVIDGLLYQGAKMLIGATAKAGKSHFTMGLARALSKAEKFLKWQTDKPLKVLYIDFELQEPMLKARILKAFNFAVPDSFAYMSLRKFSAFRSPKALNACLRQNDVSRFDVVVFDCLYKLNDAEDENSNTAMKDVCNWLDQWGGEYDFASIVIHHFGKGQQSNKSVGDRFRGGSALSGDFDAMLSLSAHEEKDHLIVETLVRDFKETESFVVHWDYPHFIDSDLDANKHADRSGAPKKATAEDLRSKLPVGEERAMRYEQLGIERICEKTFTTRFKEMKGVYKVLKTNSSGKKQNHYYRED